MLVDEIETHLHYDAQSSLVHHLQSSEINDQCIYSTHSFACIPNNLGRGIVGTKRQGKNNNRIVNNFWGSQASETGFQPIMDGRGATSLAFLALRSALFVEGVSDSILIPALYQEANDGLEASFQTIPSLAAVSARVYPQLNRYSSRVAFLVDGDTDGKRYKDNLLESGVDEDAIFQLPAPTLENCVSSDLYVKAVRQCMPSPPTTLDTEF